jgi:hypothetical protein
VKFCPVKFCPVKLCPMKFCPVKFCPGPVIFLALTLFVQYLVTIYWAVMLYYVILNTMEIWHVSDWHWYILFILHPTCILHPILQCIIAANFRKIPLAPLKISLFLYLQSIKDIDPCDPDNDQRCNRHMYKF